VVNARPKIVVIGGSSPFATTLFDEMAQSSSSGAPRDRPWSVDIVLSGRDQKALELVAGYGRHRLEPLGAGVTWTTDMSAAVDGATVVIHQNRYGGMKERRLDETFAAALGSPGDETLGPGGLRAAMRMVPGLRAVAAAVERHSPDAVVVNLSNPLSCATWMISTWSGCLTLGLCELPKTTFLAACDLIGLDPGSADWDYVGLNHRGFISAIRSGGQNLISELCEHLDERRGATLGGVTADDIAGLGAIPLKYFSLVRERSAPGPSRAAYLQRLRLRALRELERRPGEPPASITGREQPWYRHSVVPFLCQWVTPSGSASSDHVVNLVSNGGIAREIRVEIHGQRLQPRSIRSEPSPAVQSWLRTFEDHERLVIDAALEPSAETVRAALAADPLVAPEAVERGVRMLIRSAGPD
jgi:6-phospho-beta-glucosidase